MLSEGFPDFLSRSTKRHRTCRVVVQGGTTELVLPRGWKEGASHYTERRALPGPHSLPHQGSGGLVQVLLFWFFPNNMQHCSCTPQKSSDYRSSHQVKAIRDGHTLTRATVLCLFLTSWEQALSPAHRCWYVHTQDLPCGSEHGRLSTFRVYSWGVKVEGFRLATRPS